MVNYKTSMTTFHPAKKHFDSRFTSALPRWPRRDCSVSPPTHPSPNSRVKATGVSRRGSRSTSRSASSFATAAKKRGAPRTPSDPPTSSSARRATSSSPQSGAGSLPRIARTRPSDPPPPRRGPTVNRTSRRSAPCACASGTRAGAERGVSICVQAQAPAP
jgi:hypothetical protein